LGLAASALGLVVISGWGTTLLGREATPILGWYFALGVLGLLAHKTISTLFQAQENFGRHVWLEATHTAIKFLLVVSLGLAGVLSGAGALLVIGVAPVLTLLLNASALNSRFIRLGSIAIQSIARVFAFSRWIMLSFGLSAIHSRLDILMLGYLRESSEVGIYSASLTLGMGIEMIATFAATVFYPKVMPLQASGRLGPFFHRVLLYSVPLVAAGIALSFVLAGPIVVLLYGATYEASIPLLRLHAAGYFIWWLVFPLACPILFMMKPRWMVAIDLCTLIFIGFGNLALIRILGALGAAIVFLASKVVLTGVILVLTFVVVGAGDRSVGRMKGHE
jgi:O-antigen/teichoic acid export membrane protein